MSSSCDTILNTPRAPIDNAAGDLACEPFASARCPELPASVLDAFHLTSQRTALVMGRQFENL